MDANALIDELCIPYLKDKFSISMVNLYGGPCSGKSVIAAMTFGELKLRGYNARYIDEYAQKLLYEENQVALRNQVYVFSKTLKKIMDLDGKVDIGISDSPLLLQKIYGKYYPPTYKALVDDMVSRFNNLDIYIERPDKYQTEGRNQDLEQSKKIDKMVRGQLDYLGINYYVFKATPDVYKDVANLVEEWYTNLKAKE